MVLGMVLEMGLVLDLGMGVGTAFLVHGCRQLDVS